MTKEIADIVLKIKTADDPRDLLLEYTELLSHCQYRERRDSVLQAIREQNASQNIGYLFEVTSHIKGYAYLEPMANTLYGPPQGVSSLVPLSERTKGIYLLRKPEPISTKWKMLSRTSAEEIEAFLNLYGAEYGIRQEIRKKKSCLASSRSSTDAFRARDTNASSQSI